MQDKMLKLSNGKKIVLPCRMFQPTDLKRMEIDFVENGILFNRTDPGQDFPAVLNKTKSKMAVLNYCDFSTTPFSEQKLKESTEKQIHSEDCDFVILPIFKGETAHQTRLKIKHAEEIRLLTDKNIILEIPYNSELNSQELANASGAFDILALHYGVHYGHFKQLACVIKRLVEIRQLPINKKIFCMAVPLKFAGDSVEDVYYMPLFGLISDGWVKNWKRGRGPQKIKLTDQRDLRCKTYTGWLETGHMPNEILMIVGRTVYELFNDPDKLIRSEYEILIADEILSEIRDLNEVTFEKYVYTKFHAKYVGLVIRTYTENMIARMFRWSEVFSRFSAEEKRLLESEVRRAGTPSNVFGLIAYLTQCVVAENIMSVPVLIQKLKARNGGPTTLTSTNP